MRILAVKTDPIVLEVLVQLLVDRTDYDALAAVTTDAAQALLDDPLTQPFDCMIIDADVDQADTWRFVAKLRADAIHTDLPVLALTQDTSKATLDAAFHAGVTDIIAKPFEISALGGRLALAARSGPRRTRAGLLAPLEITSALPVFDAPSFVSHVAFENYAKALTQYQHGGSPAFAFAINDIRALHHQLSPFAFHCMINDVADVAAAQMPNIPHLLTYAGAGLFMAVTTQTWQPHVAPLATAINLALRTTEICDDADTPLKISICASHAVRLGAGRAAYDTLAHLRAQAESACQSHTRINAPYVLLDRIA